MSECWRKPGQRERSRETPAPGRSREKGLLSPERQKRCGRRQGTDTPDRGPLPWFRAGVPERGRICQTGRIRCPAGEQQTRGEAVGGADEKSGQGNVPVTDAEQRRQADRDKGEEKPTYQQLIAGEYAEAHKAYMDRTIAERFRKFSADRARLEKATDLLSTIAEVYGVDPRAEDFYEQLRNKVAVDDSRAAQYAAENDCSVETARKMLQMQLESAQSRQAARRAEQARQEYLDRRGVRQSYRWTTPPWEL